MGHVILGAWPVTLRKVPNMPFRRFANPFCSDFSVSVWIRLIARRGEFTPKAASIKSAPSLVRPVLARIFSATLFVASEALRNKQSRDDCANNVLAFVRTALDPVRFVGSHAAFDASRSRVNEALAFSGYHVGENGTLTRVKGQLTSCSNTIV